MSDGGGSSVTLIYYKIGSEWWKEPFLNVVAAAAQMSALTHVEIAIGGDARALAQTAPCTRAQTRAQPRAQTRTLQKNLEVTG